MASTYNFTVRAEDDQGAFADRDFSIVVKNTSVDRYMVVDATDAYTSPDMVTWTKRNGQGGIGVAYGGGKWMIQKTSSGTNVQYLLSTDGINFTLHSMNDMFETAHHRRIMHLPEYHDGYWWVMAISLSTTQSTSGRKYVLFKSSDGIVWDLVGKKTTGSDTFTGAPSFADGYIMYGSGRNANVFLKIPYDHDSSEELPTATHSSPSGFTLPTTGQIYSPYKINDLWIRPLDYGTTASSIFTSYYSNDFNTWYVGDAITLPRGSSTIHAKLDYVNGLLVCKTVISGEAASVSNTISRMAVSKNGKTWTPVPNIEGFLATTHAVETSVVQTKGKIYILDSNKFFVTDDMFETVEETTLGDLPTTTAVSFATIR